MARTDWLADRRTEVAVDRILDAAERLFTQHDPASVGMNEIAGTAGCSRATLYRYFENRDALYNAYVRRWTDALYRRLTETLAGIEDPRQRLITGVIEAIALVRRNPALASWFARTGPLIGAEMAERSETVAAAVAALVRSLGPADAEAVRRRADWLLRVMTSLLVFPGHDAAAERAMLEEFVVPVITPGRSEKR